MAKSKSHIAEVLIEFGLSDVEADVYQAALTVGSRPASVIAQKTGLKRGHTYNILHGLAQKGIVQEFVKGGVKHFTCVAPTSLLSMLEHRERQIAEQKARLERVIPELEALRSPLLSQPKVRFYQGFEGINEVFDDFLRVPDTELLFWGDLKYNWGAIGNKVTNWARDFIRRREAKNIFWRAILVSSPESDEQVTTRPSALRAMKMMRDVELPAEIWIYPGKVAFTSTSSEMVGVIIENEAIHNSLEALFHKLWELLPDYKERENEK